MHTLDKNYYLPGAEPFFFKTGPNVCLMVHGLMSSPGELKWLGERIAAQGVSVQGLRLPGHGTDHRDMRRMQWRDWYGAVVDAYLNLRAQYEKVFVLGHSTGGTLSMLLASNYPMDALVLLAAPVMFTSRIMPHTWWIKYIMPYTDQTDHTGLVEKVKEEQRRRGEPEIGRIRYDTWATNGPAQLYALGKVVRPRLNKITHPLQLVYARNDNTIPFANYDYVADNVKSTNIEKHVIEEGDHNIMLDVQRERVFSLVEDYLRRQAQGDR